MIENFDIIKGVHPGLIVDRELKKRKLRKTRFAADINEYPQTLTAITKGKRKMNPELSIKIGEALGWEIDFLMILQSSYDVKIAQENNQSKPDLSKFRPVLFWDTDINKINWTKQRKAIINRVYKRGNDIEKNELNKFYGKAVIKKYLNTNEKTAF